jgi:D-beta-D-heptose 7-phosphate kinase/D-beta-D-heptose 1-phosphate adenosyltransferase
MLEYFMKIEIPAFESARVLIVGDVMLDRYWHGDTSRISPEAPVPVVHVDAAHTEERPGGAGNVALNVASLGAQATVVGLTGRDEAAGRLQDLLNAAGVQCGFEQVDSPTVTKLRVLSRHQQLIRLDFEDGFQDYDPAPLLAGFEKRLADCGVVVLSDYGKGALRPVRELIARTRAVGKRVIVDPKGSDFDRYRGASMITPNYFEFEAVVGRCADETELVEKGSNLMAELGLEALLVTRSEHGMTLLRAGEPVLHLPTRAREVFDVTGAGDTVISVLATALDAGADLAEATALSNLAAGIVVGKLGTATVNIPELRRALHQEQESGMGVMNEEQLLEAVDIARAHGERIVMTNGCFDILHAGHVHYLDQARSRGDRLIVAVNDDDSVRRLKGGGRPVNNLERRMSVLAAMGFVDWVTPFSEDTPERVICRVKPDVLVKGGDYRPEDVAGYHCVTANGGEVVSLDFVEGCSTTDIIDRIKQE